MSKQTKKKHYRMTLGDKVLMAFIYTFLILFFVATLYPVLFVASASISDPAAVSSGKMVLWPIGINFDGFKHLMSLPEIWLGYGNTFFYTIVGTLIDLLVTIPAAYALSRRDLGGRNFLMGIFVVTMYFSGGLIPGYLNMRSFGLINTRWVILLSGAVSVYNLIVSRTFFTSSIPWELHEAAWLDGASNAKVLRTVVLPLSKPILAVMTLYYGVGHWNTYFNAMIYLRDRDKYPLQLFLREILTEAQGLANILQENMDADAAAEMMRQQDMANQLKYAVIIVATVPMLVLYPFLQKYFEKGIMIGSVKG